jgi:hypothetical protein
LELGKGEHDTESIRDSAKYPEVLRPGV